MNFKIMKINLKKGISLIVPYLGLPNSSLEPPELKGTWGLFPKIFLKNNQPHSALVDRCLHTTTLFHKKRNHKDAENFSFLAWQTKFFCS